MSLDNIMMKESIFLLGATGGIGKLLAEELKKKGYIIVGNGRKENVLISMKNEEKIIDDYVVGDLTKDEDRKKIIEKIKEYRDKGYKVTIFYNIGILYDYPGGFKNYTNEMIENSYKKNVISIEKMDRELEEKDFYLDTIYMISISAFYRGNWDHEYQKTKAALKAHSELQILNRNNRRIIALFPDTIKTGEEGMGGKLKDYPKIPGEIFVRKVVEIINGKYKEYSGFMFEIDNNNKIMLYGINPSKITNAFEFYERKSLEEIGVAVY